VLGIGHLGRVFTRMTTGPRFSSGCASHRRAGTYGGDPTRGGATFVLEGHHSRDWCGAAGFLRDASSDPPIFGFHYNRNR